jgi:hypothetical protein
MAGRILTLQRQVRELGRLRAGLTETRINKDGKEVTFPTSSKTWILTSANRDYLDAAAQLWGGQVDEWQPQGGGPKAWRVITQAPLIDAILPPGDPLSQYQEMWSRGGCQRRCDGEQELITSKPCLCRAQFGDDFHEQRQGAVCDIHTRLNVFLPDLPDIGVWRVETKGFWPANHMAGYIDMIKGHVGPQVLVPVRLRIEPRTKVKAGKTSQYIEIVVELRSQASFGEILATPQLLAIGGPADDRVIEGAPSRQAIGAAPAAAPAVGSAATPGTPVQWRQRFTQATTLDELRSMWTRAGNDGALDDETRAAYKAAGDKLLRDAAPAEDEPEMVPPVEELPVTETVDAIDWPARFAMATSTEELRTMWTACGRAGSLAANKPAWFEANAKLRAATAAVEAGQAPDADGGQVEVLTAEAEPDKDLTWTLILTEANKLGWNTPFASKAFREQMGRDVTDADGWTMSQFLEHLRRSTAVAA